MTREQGNATVLSILKRAKQKILKKRSWVNSNWCLDARGKPVNATSSTATKFHVLGAVFAATHELNHNEKFWKSAISVLEHNIPSLGNVQGRDAVTPSFDFFEQNASHSSILKLFDDSIQWMDILTDEEAWLPIGYREM